MASPHAVELARLAETGGSADAATSLAGVLSARLDTLTLTAGPRRSTLR